MSRRARRVRRGVIGAAAALAVLAPTALALAGGSRWWRYIAPEQTPMTWLQSVVLVLAGTVCLLTALVLTLVPASAQVPAIDLGRTRAPGSRIWVLLGCGFLLLALDERFAVHERVRDGYLAPRDIRLPLLTWVGPGDFLVLAVAAAGLVVLPRVLCALRADRPAWLLFAVGVLLATVAVGMDSIDPARLALSTERWEQTLEECVELAAGLCFLTALVVRLVALLDGGPVTPGHVTMGHVTTGPGDVRSGDGDMRQVPVVGQGADRRQRVGDDAPPTVERG